jgi:phage protein D
MDTRVCRPVVLKGYAHAERHADGAGRVTVERNKFGVVSSIEHAGSPDTLTIQVRSASITNELGERRETSWHGETLGAIVRKIAGRHTLKAAIGHTLAKIPIAHIDQTHESDLSFLTRLSKPYGAVMNAKEANLLFMPIGHDDCERQDPRVDGADPR